MSGGTLRRLRLRSRCDHPQPQSRPALDSRGLGSPLPAGPAALRAAGVAGTSLPAVPPCLPPVSPPVSPPRLSRSLSPRGLVPSLPFYISLPGPVSAPLARVDPSPSSKDFSLARGVNQVTRKRTGRRAGAHALHVATARGPAARPGPRRGPPLPRSPAGGGGGARPRRPNFPQQPWGPPDPGGRERRPRAGPDWGPVEPASEPGARSPPSSTPGPPGAGLGVRTAGPPPLPASMARPAGLRASRASRRRRARLGFRGRLRFPGAGCSAG